MNIEKLYDYSYYQSQALDPELRSPKVVVPLITSIVQPRSVVDVGCGVGSWLVAFRENGAEAILGLDGKHVDSTWLLIPRECFRAVDLSQSFRLDAKFDLAVCLEVAEHLPISSARVLVESLVQLAPVILFSAAIPLQGGTHHVNEQWPEYWQGLFQEYDYRMLDLIRQLIWKNPKVKSWYRQNMFLFVREDFIPTRSQFLEATQYADDLVLLKREILQQHLGLRSIFKNLPGSIWEFSRRRIRVLMSRGRIGSQRRA